jgi:predicted ATP-dependent serine protease
MTHLRMPLDSLDFKKQSTITLAPRQLDDLLRGILAPEQMSLLHGPERSPLTLLAHAIAIAAAELGKGHTVYIDSGSNYSPTLARAMCNSMEKASEILRRVVVGNVLSLSDLEELSKTIPSLDTVSVIVLDSLTGVLNLSGAPGSVGRQRELFHCLEVLRDLVNEIGAHLLMTDHSSRSWSSGRPTPIGGNVLAHAVDSVIRVDRLDVGKNLIRVLVERGAAVSESQALILVEGKDGLRPFR